MESSVSPPKPVKTLSLYVVSRDPWDVDYDEYDGVVVAAENEAHALTFEPLPRWTKFDTKPASVQYIGTAAPDTQPGIIFTSLKAR